MSSKPKVLIVDDEARFRTTMCKLLAVRGLEAFSTGSGKEAIEALRAKSYDVLVMDLRMPEMGGAQLLSEVKKFDPFIEVIVMTGYASVCTGLEVLDLGAYSCMTKPCNIDELMEKILGAHDRRCARLAE
jgi:DNA-binding NtrC family response regulator